MIPGRVRVHYIIITSMLRAHDHGPPRQEGVSQKEGNFIAFGFLENHHPKGAPCFETNPEATVMVDICLFCKSGGPVVML